MAIHDNAGDMEKQAKVRALHLLERMDRTEAQLREKLQQDFSGDIVESAIQYVKSFGYVNDENYTRRYIENRKSTKSKTELKMLLLQKGIAKEVIQEVLIECYTEEDATETIRKLLEKKHFCAETATDKEKQRIYGYLLRKGFHYEDIRQVIQVYSC